MQGASAQLGGHPVRHGLEYIRQGLHIRTAALGHIRAAATLAADGVALVATALEERLPDPDDTAWFDRLGLVKR